MANRAVDGFRRRFHELRDEVEAIEERAAPHRAARDKVVAKIANLEAEAARHAEAARKVETDGELFDKKNELAALARAVGNRVGVREDDGTIWHPEDADDAIPERFREKARAERAKRSAPPAPEA